MNKSNEEIVQDVVQDTDPLGQTNVDTVKVTEE